MKWPDIAEAAREPWFLGLAETLPEDFNNSQRANALLWCLARFNPELVQSDTTAEQMDKVAAEMMGISEGELYDSIFPTYKPFIAALILDVLDCFGGSKYKRWQAGKLYLRMAYDEVVKPLSETDEDKRAAVMLKKGEVLKSLKDIEKELQEISNELFGKSDTAKLAALTTVLTPESRAKAKVNGASRRA